jgi:hypothetical protein
MHDLGVAAYIPPQPHAKHPAAQHARALTRTPVGVDVKIQRTVHAEGAISELKRHGRGRARSRGTRKLQLQLLAAATAINLKRLLAHQNADDASNTQDNRSDRPPTGHQRHGHPAADRDPATGTAHRHPRTDQPPRNSQKFDRLLGQRAGACCFRQVTLS